MTESTEEASQRTATAPTGDASAGGSPAEFTVTLDEAEARALREAGRAWASVPRARVGGDGVDPDLAPRVEGRGERPGDRYVRVRRARRDGFEAKAPGWLQATLRASEPKTGWARRVGRVRRLVLGAPVQTRQSITERLTKVKALAVLSSDALSSVAYATDQTLLVLVGAGAAAFSYTVPIMGAIILLLVAVGLSYRQTIKAYPRGGGSYIVASDNLGHFAGVVAGSALMTDYVLTVAVSIASGVDNISSAAPGVESYRVPIAVGLIVLLVLGNLRGIRESGSIFAAPTYLFIGAVFLTLGVCIVKVATGQAQGASPVLHIAQRNLEPITVFLVLRAFASGCTALTGVEAISDGVPAFKPPEWRNARTTLTIMVTVLGMMFAGITLLAHHFGLVPHASNTIISQLAHKAFGDGVGVGYVYVIASTTAILILAANTSFSDFPRLFFFMARDDFAPHLFKRLGDRLAYSNGIIVLGGLAMILEVVFGGHTDRLIPLYTIGVFLAFTMSQAGMVSRWLRRREAGWQRGLVINALGMVMTAVVFITTATVKFKEGAFVVVFIIPLLVAIFRSVHRHYSEVATLTATETPTSPDKVNPVCIVPVADLNGVALQSLAMARTLSDDVIAVHISDDEGEIALLRAKWDAWGNHVPLEIIESQYRALVRPLLSYIDAIDKQRRGDTLVVVLPELVATRWWHALLHNQSALRLKAALLFRPGTVVINVPYHLRRVPRARRRLRIRDSDSEDL